MISNRPQTILVDGVDNANVIYKRGENDIANSRFYVMNGNNQPLGSISLAITAEISGCFVKPIVLHKSTIYNITGVASPGDTTVFISYEVEKGSIDALKNNVIYTAYADKQGNFKFENVICAGEVINMWVSTLAQDATTASLTYELEVVGFAEELGQIVVDPFIKEDDGKFTSPKFQMIGTCSEDIETVYVSCINEEIGSVNSSEAVSYLMENMCCSSTPSEGTFNFKFSGDYDQLYFVWAITNHGGSVQITDTIVEEDTSTCLSADTMITMADGTKKRMDNICVGDIVLSENNYPTRVHTVKHNCFSDYHVLYHFEDGTIINETHPHRFYNVEQGFWQRLQLWNIGDHAINQNGDKVALVSVERIDEEIEMFGIWTDNGTYYANGLLSGAAFCNKKLLENATAEQAVDMMLSADESWLLQLMGLEDELP